MLTKIINSTDIIMHGETNYLPLNILLNIYHTEVFQIKVVDFNGLYILYHMPIQIFCMMSYFWEICNSSIQASCKFGTTVNWYRLK
jgi:hypothetical protein